jgi:DNA-binding NtrC family response regulator
VFAIRPPPLQDRRADVMPLSEAFLSEIGRSLGRPPGGISRAGRDRTAAITHDRSLSRALFVAV